MTYEMIELTIFLFQVKTLLLPAMFFAFLVYIYSTEK